MFSKLLLSAAAGVVITTAAFAQTPAPPNVNPGSMQSGAEETGAGNQPRSPEMNSHGTRSAPRGGVRRPAIETDGVNANVKAGSTHSGHSESGPAASEKR
jgi:hypothetical protein